MGTTNGRRAWVIGLAVALLMLFLALGALNAFNLRLLDPESPLETLVFVALSIVAFLLFVGVLVVLVRNLLKLYADQRSRVLGTRLRTRMLGGAVLVSLAPLSFMFAFSYLLMNRAVDRWFSQPVTEMRDDTQGLLRALTHYATANTRAEADTLALELSGIPALNAASDQRKPDSVSRASAAIDQVLELHKLSLQGGFALIFHDDSLLASYNLPEGPLAASAFSSDPANALRDSAASRDSAVDSGDAEEVRLPSSPTGLPGQLARAAEREEDSFVTIGGVEYSLATAGLKHGGVVIAGLPLPRDVAATNGRLQSAERLYWTVFRERRQVRSLYTGLLLLITLLALFACCWLALHLSKQVTRPLESLAEAMEAIAAGDYARRVEESATEELGELAGSFNAMAGDLASARSAAEASAAQLGELNTALERRRTELETIIETIPTGLVTLSPDHRIVLVNRAFSEMLDPGGERGFVGVALKEVLPAEAMEVLERLLQRSHRMGSASAELELPAPSGVLQVSAVIAPLERGPAREPLGYVLVLEDVSEVLRAQKQSAWKEVARRVAHEIKNPLTPISLNAELVRRHIDRLGPTLAQHGLPTRSVEVIQRSTEVIGASVQTLRSLVDQFASLAEFPTSHPRPADLNAIMENALALFTGRLGSIRVRRRFAPGLPLALADPEALKRAVSNLIDNAAEAMSDSLLRELEVSTRLLDSGMLELSVADTGSGLTDDMRERLFLPYFSTKQRGTGLGLSIAAKIVQEHGGTIRAENNRPSGARFLVELKPAPVADAGMEASMRLSAQQVSA